MNRDDTEWESWYRAAADAYLTFEQCRERIASARQSAADKPGAEQSLRRQELPILLEMINVAFHAHDLQDLRPPSRTYRPTPRELREAEHRRSVPEGTFLNAFLEGFREPWAANVIRTQEGLLAAKKLIEAEQRATNPSVLDRLAEVDLGPAIVRICCATVVGALIGAPLGALAIHENILSKMYESAVVTGLTALAAEIYNPLSELASRDRLPDEPVRTPDIFTVLDDMTEPGKPPGSLPDFNDITAWEPPPARRPEDPPSPWSNGPGRF